MTTAADIFAKMPERFNSEAAKNLYAVFQYNITGNQGGKWYTVIDNGKLDIQKGQHEDPNITLTMSESDYVDMVEGRLNGQMAYLNGKLKINGDITLALKLASLFKL